MGTTKIGDTVKTSDRWIKVDETLTIITTAVTNIVSISIEPVGETSMNFLVSIYTSGSKRPQADTRFTTFQYATAFRDEILAKIDRL